MTHSPTFPRYKRNSYHGSDVVPTAKSLHGRPRPFSVQRGLIGDEGAKPEPLPAFTLGVPLCSLRSIPARAVSRSAVAHPSIGSIDVPHREA